eukprot:g14910.t1
MIELNVLTISGTPTPTSNGVIDTDDDTNSSSNASTTSTPPCLEPPSPATTVRSVSYKDAASRSLPARHSLPKPAGAATSAKRVAGRVTTSCSRASVAAGTAAADPVANRSVTRATAVATRRAVTAAAATTVAMTPPAAPSRLRGIDGLLEMEIPRPRHDVTHLPVFQSLCEGNSLARSNALPLSASPRALTRGEASAGGAADGDVEGAAPSPAPSSCSVYYSPTSSASPSEAATPPSPVVSITAAAGTGVVQVEGECFFSCPSSPAMLLPPPGFETAHSLASSGGWSSTSTDAASWTSSGCSPDHDDAFGGLEQDDDHDVDDNGRFDFLQHFDESVPDPSTLDQATSEGRVPRTTGRLPRLPHFAGLHPSNDTIASKTTSNTDTSTRTATNGCGGMGMLYPVLSGGGGSGGGAVDGAYLTACDSGDGIANGYYNGGGFPLDAIAAAQVAPLKTQCRYPVAQAQAQAEYHGQHPYPDAGTHNAFNIYATNAFQSALWSPELQEY